MGSVGPTSTGGIRIAIDRGGTFTDCVASVPGRDDILIKLLSVDPANYPDAPVEAIRRVLEEATGKRYPKGKKISLAGVESIKMGTTVATNALLERKGEPTAFLVTRGLKDLLHIGNQSRPKLFDMRIAKPEVLYSEVREVSERVTLESWTEKKRSSSSKPPQTPPPEEEDTSDDPSLVRGITGETVRILQPLDIPSTLSTLQDLYSRGYRSVAVCLMHSYTFPQHEREVGRLAREVVGFPHVSLSSELSPTIKMVPRGNSANADAYLTPEIKRYIEGFVEGFEDLGGEEGGQGGGCRCEFMQSDGGLVEFSGLSGLRSILSGPAGGCVGYARTAYYEEEEEEEEGGKKKMGKPVIGFDMGGTSTDVSRYAGKLEQVFETTTAGIIVQSPQLDINTVAAGGGSILTWDSGMFKVGPESASAHPGPACYRKGGPLTVTDANLVLGRLRPEFFPKIFGPNEDLPLDLEASLKLFREMTDRINNDITERSLSLEEVAAGFLDVANESMCRPIRTLTEARGYDASQHNLSSFGGAGGQHCCDMARKLGISRVLIHKYSSLLSAYGMALADVVHEERSPSALIFQPDNFPTFTAELDKLEKKSVDMLLKQRIDPGRIVSERYLNMRFGGSDTALMIQQQTEKGLAGLLEDFKAAHQQEFGFLPTGRDVIIDDQRVRSIGSSSTQLEKPWKPEFDALAEKRVTLSGEKCETKKVYFPLDGWVDVPVYHLDGLTSGSTIPGPALLMDSKQTLVVTPLTTATVLSNNVVIDIEGTRKEDVSASKADPIQLSIFGHRFMGVAEQMGRALGKTSVSVNIKERLDFSCTVFSPDGGLVANAPHVPAMIGSMAFAVKWQIQHWGEDDLKPGDVILTNSPVCGGTHLPDLTVITPVFDRSGSEIIFWTASRGHHADIGGILPGSMPPNSKELWQEGAVIYAFKVIENGVFKEEELTSLLMAPASLPDCQGTRCLQDNISDIKAQAAANHRGSQLIHSLIDDYSLPVVQFYMQETISAASLAVRNMLKQIASSHHQRQSSSSSSPSPSSSSPITLRATDHMDDGTPLTLTVTIFPSTGTAHFDFTGTGPECLGNWNAPLAITHSSIIFALRSMVSVDIPLNQGALLPIKVTVPTGTLLSPSPEAAVCAGNVLTSQRIVDVIFKCFGAMAAGQGCMNNLTFGIDGGDENVFGYYETICGGAGAGPTWNGRSGVHSNMTNTRITDPEVLERRYPVLLRRFCLREGSAGEGKFRGGEGVVREIEFRIPGVKVSILSERRGFAPYGMCGGGEGGRGRNTWVKAAVKGDDGKGEERVVNLGGKNSTVMGVGDRIVVESPGGGGWGVADEGDKSEWNTEEGKVEGGKEFMAVGGGSVGNIMAMGESA